MSERIWRMELVLEFVADYAGMSETEVKREILEGLNLDVGTTNTARFRLKRFGSLEEY